MADEQKLLSQRGREQRLTEKGRGYQTDQKSKQYKELLKKLRSCGGTLVELVTQNETSEVIQMHFDVWKHDYVEFVQIFEVLCSLTEEQERKVLQEEHVRNITEVNEVKLKIETHLSSVGVTRTSGAKSVTAGSRSSRMSSSSSEVKTRVVLMKLQMQQDRAELEARAAMTQKRMLLKQKQEQLLLEQEQLDIETERSINEAKLKVVEQFETESQDGADIPGVQEAEADADNLREDNAVNDSRPALNDVTCNEPAHVRLTNDQSEDNRSSAEAVLHRLADVLAEQHMTAKLPVLEPSVYRGNVEEFPMWLKAFETYIEHRTTSPIERLHFLGRYTAGEAKTAILGLLHLRTEEAYQQAKSRLRDRFGNDFIVSNAYRMKIRSWPAIRSEDGRALRDFADFLEHCQATAASSPQHLGILDDYLEIQMMVKKLPKYLVDRWKREVDKWLYNREGEATGRHPPFAEFVRFVRVEARIACGPVDVDMPEDRRATPSRAPQSKVRTFVSATEVKKAHTEHDDGVRRTLTCELCQQQHEIKNCDMFKNMTVGDRNIKVNQLSLCRGCLKKGHRWKECRSREKCDVCSRWHPTLLHDESFSHRGEMRGDSTGRQEAHRAPQAMTLRSGSAGGEGESCSHSLVLPVLLSHQANPEQQVLVYAVLDAQSDACFVSESICETLSVEGRETKLDLSTMTGKSVIDSRAIEGLMIQPLKEDEVIKLPTVYTRPEIPCSKENIPKKETAKKWRHLEGIADKMPAFFQNAQVALLLGTNCSRAIKPLEVISGQDDEPWAVRTQLGWGVVGRHSASEAACQRADTADHQKRSHFAFRSQVRKVSPLEVLKVLEPDCRETGRENETSLPMQDQQLVKMSEGLRQRDNGHFEMSRPLKNDKMFLPNNKTMALQRPKRLKAKLTRDHVQEIRDHTEPAQWMHVASEQTNCRPLTYCDPSPDSPLPLTPMALLTHATNVVPPPHGNFQRRTCTAADAGGGCSTWRPTSGRAGGCNTSRGCRGGRRRERISSRTTSGGTCERPVHKLERLLPPSPSVPDGGGRAGAVLNDVSGALAPSPSVVSDALAPSVPDGGGRAGAVLNDVSGALAPSPSVVSDALAPSVRDGGGGDGGGAVRSDK